MLKLHLLLTVLCAVPGAARAGAQTGPCEADLGTMKARVLCHDLAFKSLAENPAFARAKLSLLCDQYSLPRACSNLAFSYVAPGAGRAPDYISATAYYQRGCDLGDGVACNNLADMFFRGAGLPQDKPAGVKLLQKACALAYPPACYRLAVITLRGILLKNDPAAAATLLKKGCDLGDAPSCNDLGYAYMDGNGVPRDKARALEAITASCDRGLPRGCGSLGTFYMMGTLTAADYPKARGLLAKACAGDDFGSCSNLGYMIEAGEGAAADPKSAAQYYAKACTGGDAYGCGNLGVLLAAGRGGVPADDAAALPKLSAGCAEQAGEACRYLALFHEAGRAGLPRSGTAAKFYREKACEAGDEPSCAVLAAGLGSLCDRKEDNVLSCMTGGESMLSLCLKTTGGAAALLYRSGKKNSAEMTYNGKMAFSSETWGDGEKYLLSFNNGPARYEVEEAVMKNTEPPTRKVRVNVDLAGKKTAMDCRYPVAGTLSSGTFRTAGNLGPGIKP